MDRDLQYDMREALKTALILDQLIERRCGELEESDLPFVKKLTGRLADLTTQQLRDYMQARTIPHRINGVLYALPMDETMIRCAKAMHRLRGCEKTALNLKLIEDRAAEWANQAQARVN